ncbi:MAG: acyl-CoA reductase [Comamonas sp.]
MKTQRITAGYLPGLRDDEVQWHLLPFERTGLRLEVAVPVLTSAQMQALADRVRAGASRHLREMPVAEIIDAIDRAIARLLDRDDPWRREAEAWLPVVSGYDADMVRLGLTGFFKTFRAAQLRRFVAEDFANPGVLDGFQPAAKGGAVRAFGPDLLVHSWAGNVPALSLWSLVCGLLVKAPSIGKLASAEPLFAGWFARLLAEVHPPLADCLAVVWWDGAGGESGLGGEGAARLYAQADTVLAYGGNQTLDALRRRLPVTTRFLPHGHKLGFGLVGAAALDALKAPAVARLAAWDVMRYDQQGCYSPHVFYVERGAPVLPRAFADHLAAELANLQRRFARRALALEEGAAVAKWQQAVEWGGAGDLLIGTVDAPWSVAYSDTLQPLAPTALHRSISVVGVDCLDAVVPVVAQQREYLQTAGIAAGPEELYRLAGLLGAAGVTRICAMGAMSMPEAGWHNDGRFNLLDLVRMTEIEQSAEIAAQPFASYAD